MIPQRRKPTKQQRRALRKVTHDQSGNYIKVENREGSRRKAVTALPITPEMRDAIEQRRFEPPREPAYSTDLTHRIKHRHINGEFSHETARLLKEQLNVYDYNDLVYRRD